MVLIGFREIWNGPSALNRWCDSNPNFVKSDVCETQVTTNRIFKVCKLSMMANLGEIGAWPLFHKSQSLNIHQALVNSEYAK